jgi:hypothetical protein
LAVADDGDLLVRETCRTREREEGIGVAVGDWYWVLKDEDPYDSRHSSGRWLGCVTHVGTNYVQIEGPSYEHRTRSARVLLRDLPEQCVPEPRAVEHVAAKLAELRARIAGAVGQIQAISSRLGLGPREGGDAAALEVYDGRKVEDYQRQLVQAQQDEIPGLQKEIEQASSEMSAWLQAEAIPLRAESQKVEGMLGVVKRRISAVEVYAGLVEELVQIKQGEPTGTAEPVYLFQRRHYMDEECLANYQAGGMRFAHLRDFEKWLCQRENFTRIFPHPRAVVAFRVRRHEAKVSIREFVTMLFGDGGQLDKTTYLYIRNGDQLHRLSTNVDFGEQLFPDASHSVYARGRVRGVMFAGRVDRLATEDEYQDLVRRTKEAERKRAAMPEDEKWRVSDPHEWFYNWEPWDESSVYHDDISDHVRQVLEDHNRLVLLLQGVLDRSSALSPHEPCHLWQPEDFERRVRLVYDDSRALAAGDLPDFLAYQGWANRKLRAGCHTVGQEVYWEKREAKLENRRLVARYGHEKSQFMLEDRYRPDNDPGPGTVARVLKYAAGRCHFDWVRPRRVRGFREPDGFVRDHLVVPAAELLCVEGYSPGDYHKFYDDPRTRADYLQWAPLLLRAEEWYATRKPEPG